MQVLEYDSVIQRNTIIKFSQPWKKCIQSAFSIDGYTWTMDEGRRVDGSYVMIYTGVGTK